MISLVMWAYQQLARGQSVLSVFYCWIVVAIVGPVSYSGVLEHPMQQRPLCLFMHCLYLSFSLSHTHTHLHACKLAGGMM